MLLAVVFVTGANSKLGGRIETQECFSAVRVGAGESAAAPNLLLPLLPLLLQLLLSLAQLLQLLLDGGAVALARHPQRLRDETG